MKRHLLLFALLLLISGALFGQLAVDPTSLNGFAYVYDDGPSATKSFSVSGTNLPESVTITATTDFQVSLIEMGEDSFSSDLTLIPVEGTLTETTVYVRMVAELPIGNHIGAINVTCGDELSETVTLNGEVSAIGTVASPIFSPQEGTYSTAQEIIIDCTTEDASIYYSTISDNGPWTSYTESIIVNESMTIWAYASKEGYTDSTVASATYTINIPDPATLTVTPENLSDFSYPFGYGPSESQIISISGNNLASDITITAPNDFEINRSADGSFSRTLTLQINEGTLSPTNVFVRMQNGLTVGQHIGDLTVNCDTIIKYVALRGEVTQQPQVEAPTFTPQEGTHPGPLTVSISCNTENATIHYTTNGTEPTESSPVYSAPLNIETTVTIKAKAWKAGYQASATASATYTITYTVSVLANSEEGGSPYVGSTPGTTQSTFTSGQQCTVHANPNPGYTFQRWTENNNQVSTQTDYSFTVTSNRNLVAHFTQDTYTITVLASPPQGGAVTGGGAYHYGDHPTLTATASSGYAFQGWNDGNTQNPRTITVTGNATYTAFFSEAGTTYYNVSATVSPAGAGTVTGTGPFPAGSTTQLTAIPNNGYTFSHWNDGNTQNPRTVTVNGDMEFTACFNRVPCTISVSAKPTNGGMVHVGNTNLQQVTYYYGQFCTVYANPSTGYTFTNWTENGNVVCEYLNYYFQVTDDRNLVANFTQAGSTDYTIDAEINPAGSGIVNGIGTYPSGTQVTLEAIPNDGYTFDHWQDGTTDNPRTITVTGNATYTVFFSEAGTTYYNVSAIVSPAGAGTVSGTGPFPAGSTTQLTAVPNNGYTFDHWNDGSTENPRTITVTGNATYTAYFTQAGSTEYTITTNVIPKGSGTVNGSGSYPTGTQVILEAIANEGYTFDHWQDGNTDNPRTITVTGNATYTATFKQNIYTITVSANPTNAGTVFIGDDHDQTESTFNHSQQCTVHAVANLGFIFINWTKNDGQQVSSSLDYTFDVTETLDLVANFGTENDCIIFVDIDPEEGGTATGAGIYSPGNECTLKAFAKPGYKFKNWTLGDEEVSQSPNHTFNVSETARYVAHFEMKKYTITASANPEAGGSITGDGTYKYGVTCTLKATPNQGYTFYNWTEEDGTVVWTYATYTFTVSSDRNLIANFKTEEVYCIEDPKNIEPKYHTDKDGHKYILLLVYPNHNDIYTYQWSYARPNSDLDSLIYNPIGIDQPYYYEEGGLRDGLYMLSITKKGEGCLPYVTKYQVTGNKNNNKLLIYPNPSRRDHNIVVVNDSNGPSQLSIYSTDGRPLHAQTVTDNQTTLNLNLPSGVYIVYLTDSNGYTKIGKLVIQ